MISVRHTHESESDLMYIQYQSQTMWNDAKLNLIIPIDFLITVLIVQNGPKLCKRVFLDSMKYPLSRVAPRVTLRPDDLKNVVFI